MKLEFYALIIFFATVSIFLAVGLFETRPREEEVFPSPFVFAINPFSESLFRIVNQMNKQLLLLEYNISTPAEFESARELENLYNVIEDPRATKNLTKHVLVTWWGNAITSVCFTVKHITVCWRPTIDISETSKKYSDDFGSALLLALSGLSTRCTIGEWNIDIAKLIAERYGVTLRIGR